MDSKRLCLALHKTRLSPFLKYILLFLHQGTAFPLQCRCRSPHSAVTGIKFVNSWQGQAAASHCLGGDSVSCSPLPTEVEGGESRAAGMPQAGAAPAASPHPRSASASQSLFRSQKSGWWWGRKAPLLLLLAHSDFISSLGGEAARCETWDVAFLGCRTVSPFNVAPSLCTPTCSSAALSGNVDRGRGWLSQFVFLLLLFPLLFFFGNLFSSSQCPLDGQEQETSTQRREDDFYLAAATSGVYPSRH